jgi:hypothetical protein
MQMLEELAPGDEPSYELCKLIYAGHVYGQKIIEAPLQMVFSQQRAISGVPDAVRIAFESAWKRYSADTAIRGAVRTSKQYGVSTLAETKEGQYSVFDPFNTSGSFGNNSNPEADNFLKTPTATVGKKSYGPGECVVLHNGAPIYLLYVASGFGYTGRSVYHACCYELQTLIDIQSAARLVAQKAGVLVMKTDSTGSTVTGNAQQIASVKRNYLKEARTSNVLQAGTEDTIESLNMMHSIESVEGAKNAVLDIIAAAVGMPALILKSEILAQGLGGSGAEDSKVIANYISAEREAIEPLYDFMLPRIQKLAWTPEFFEAFKENNPEYADLTYEQAFYEWQDQMVFEWPDFLREQKSEKAKAVETTMTLLKETFTMLSATVSPDDRRILCQFIMDNLNSEEIKEFLPVSLDLNLDGDFSTPAPTEVRETISEDDDDSAVSESTNQQGKE